MNTCSCTLIQRLKCVRLRKLSGRKLQVVYHSNATKVGTTSTVNDQETYFGPR